MNCSGAYRLLLLVFLPMIAFLIFIEGRTYDPGLIRFDLPASEGGGTASFFPPDIDGYRMAGRVRSYTKENLYEYVDGHAEYFISAGLIGLAVGEYGRAGSSAAEPDVVVDIYDMGRNMQAFGVLSDESAGSTEELQAGVTGFRTPRGVSFMRGRYYVKVSAFDEKVPLDAFTKGIAEYIEAEPGPFPGLSRLPDAGRLVATRYIREAYRGLDFVNNVIEQEYEKNGESVHVFVIGGEKKEIERTAGSFAEYFRRSDIPYTISEKKGGRIYRIRDPYEGAWVMIVSRDALYGIYGAYDDEMINAILIR